MREIRVKSCPRCCLCGAEGRPLYADLVDILFGAPGTWKLSQCSNPACGLLWLNPRPIDEDLPLIYAEYYTHQPEAAPRRKTLLSLRSMLFRIYGLAMGVPRLLMGLHREKQRIDSMYLDDLPAGRLLDVGCGDGTFLAQMRSRGWEVSGLDFDEAAIKAAKEKYGLNVFCGHLRDAPFPRESFDAVVMKHVIEHVPDPIDFLSQARHFLKPGGRLVAVTPNTSSLGHSHFKQSWRGLEPPRHLQIFSPSNLGDCARKAGLDPLSAGSSAANADVIAGASFSICDRAARIGHQPVPNLARTWKAVCFQFRESRQIRIDPRCGEEAVLLAVRPPA